MLYIYIYIGWPNSAVPIEHTVVSRETPPGAVIRSTKWKIVLGCDAAVCCCTYHMFH